MTTRRETIMGFLGTLGLGATRHNVTFADVEAAGAQVGMLRPEKTPNILRARPDIPNRKPNELFRHEFLELVESTFSVPHYSQDMVQNFPDVQNKRSWSPAFKHHVVSQRMQERHRYMRILHRDQNMCKALANLMGYKIVEPRGSDEVALSSYHDWS